MKWLKHDFPSQKTRWIVLATIIFTLNISQDLNIEQKFVVKNEKRISDLEFREPASVKKVETTVVKRKPIPSTLKPMKVKDLRKTMNTSEIKSVLLDHFFPQSLGDDYQIEILSYKDGLYKKAHFEVYAYKVQVEIKRKSDGAINNFSLWFDKKNQVVLESFGKNKIEYGKNIRLSHPLIR